MNEEEIRIFMRLCPYRKSTFKIFFKKIKEMSSITNSSFNLESHKELDLFLGELKKHMEKEYKERSNFIIINGESFSDEKSVEKKVIEITNKEKRTTKDRLFVRECIRYHPEIIKIKNDLYRDTNKHGRKKIERIIFLDGDIFLKLEGIKKLDKFNKQKIYKAIKSNQIDYKKIQLKGSVPFTIDQTINNTVPKAYEISLTDCNNFLINVLKEYYTTDYPNPRRIVYGNLDNNRTLLVENVYGNFKPLKLKDIFDKDNYKYCQGYLILNERGNWTCSFCKNVVVNNNINIVYPTYDKKKAGLQDSFKVSKIQPLTFKKWKEKITKELSKALEEAEEIGPKEIKKAVRDINTWNSKKDKEKKKEWENTIQK